MKKLTLPFVLTTLAASIQFAHAQELQLKSSDLITTPTSVQINVEKIKLPLDETMGMMGGSYLFKISDSFSIGPAAYGAITGQRGGFFTGGAEATAHLVKVGSARLNAGVYVGGGGGGSSLVGGGLMLRPHIDLMWDFGGVSAGLSATQVRFPNGHIQSKQLGVTLAFDTDFVHSDVANVGKSIRTLTSGGVGFDRIHFAVGNYNPLNGVKDLSGQAYQKSIGYAGFRSDHFFNDNAYWGIESGAATRGGSDGYAEILGLLGYEQNIANNFAVGARAAVGMGGGGKLSVGGGLLLKAGVYAHYHVTDRVYIALEGGRVKAPDGDFVSNYGTVQLGYDLDFGKRLSVRSIKETEWALSSQNYLKTQRYTNKDNSVQMIGLKIDHFIDTNTYLSAQAHSAYAGQAGGYSVGLAGIGIRSDKPKNDVYFGGEFLVGAAGGGGIATTGGASVQALAYAGYEINKNLRVKFGVGRIKSVKGALNTNVYDISVAVPLGVSSR